MKNKLVAGDIIQIDWVDGFSNKGIFTRMDKGFILYRQSLEDIERACLPAHATITVLGNKNENKEETNKEAECNSSDSHRAEQRSWSS